MIKYKGGNNVTNRLNGCLFFVILMFLMISVVNAAEISNDTPLTEYNTITTNNHDIKEITSNNETTDNTISKKQYNQSNLDTSSKTSNSNGDDVGREVAITQNITPVNGLPDVRKLGYDYAYAEEDGVYTITGEEIRRVMKLDSYSQQIYGFVPKYTFFREEGSNVKYVISREKWNVIVRSLNSYHVKQGYRSVSTPYAITVNLSNQSRYYPIYYDAQEWINGHQYTCGPTAMSMISQGLNWYSSERRLADLYSTTSWAGTDEPKIISRSPSVNMKLTDIYDTKDSVKNALLNGKMIFWHIRGHYMCIAGYNSYSDRFLCLNPSGPSHRIGAVQWATWSELRNTDRALKENGFMKVEPYFSLTSQEKTQTKYYYYNMGGKYTTPNNWEYPNSNSKDNPVIVTVNKPANTLNQNTNKLIPTRLIIDEIKNTEFTDTVYITGRYVDNRLTNLTYTPLKLVINSNEYTVKTDGHGIFNYSYKTNTIGKNNVSISYAGNRRFKGAQTNDTFTVTRKTTKIIINQISNTQFTDEVIISGRYVDTSGTNLTYTPLKLMINSQEHTVKTNSYGIYSYTYKTDMVGTNNVSVSYYGNNRYYGANETVTFNVVTKQTKIIVNNITKTGDYVKITGKYMDISGRNLTYTPLTLNIGGKNVTVKTNKYGEFEYEYQPTVSYNTITISYQGNKRYAGTSQSIAFTVNQDNVTYSKSTIMTIDVIGDVKISENVTITGKYVAEDGTNLTYTPIRLNINGKIYTTKTDGQGIFTFNIKVDNIGLNSVTASYWGNLRYSGTTTSTSFEVIKG